MTHFALHVFTPTPFEESSDILERWSESRRVEEYVGNFISKDEAQSLRDKYHPGKTLGIFMYEWEMGNARWSEEKQGYEVLSTYNPESKWDWWTVGGRWDGSLVTTGGQKVNSAQVKDLAFMSKISLLEQEAHYRYDRFENVTAGLDIPPTFSEFMETPNASRLEYENLPWVAAVKSLGYDSWTWPHYEYHVGTGGREAYVAEKASPDVPLAWVGLDGEWHERGEAGWFGAILGEKPYHEHVDAYREYLDSVPGDTYVTLVDCHI